MNRPCPKQAAKLKPPPPPSPPLEGHGAKRPSPTPNPPPKNPGTTVKTEKLFGNFPLGRDRGVRIFVNFEPTQEDIRVLIQHLLLARDVLPKK